MTHPNPLVSAIERAGLWANLPDGRSIGRMEALDAFEAGKRAATDAIKAALSPQPDDKGEG